MFRKLHLWDGNIKISERDYKKCAHKTRKTFSFLYEIIKTWFITVICFILTILDDGLKDNILYVSADPKVDEKPETSVYAAVNKRVPESKSNANVYAEVNKGRQITAQEGALYSDVKVKKGIKSYTKHNSFYVKKGCIVFS